MGVVYFGTQKAHTLEDVARPVGVKIASETCIPEGAYFATVSRSPRFSRDMVMLSTKPEGVLDRHGCRYEGIRVHRGNDAEDTDACVLVGRHSDGIGRVWDCAAVEQELVDFVRGGECMWVVTSC